MLLYAYVQKIYVRGRDFMLGTAGLGQAHGLPVLVPPSKGCPQLPKRLACILIETPYQ